MRKSRLSQVKQDLLIEHFVACTTARYAASLIGVNRKTAAYYFHRLRDVIAYRLEQEADQVVGGEIEVDESYFGGRRKGKRGRGAAGKVPVFGLLKRDGRVYTKIIPDARSETLMAIIVRKVNRTSPRSEVRRHQSNVHPTLPGTGQTEPSTDEYRELRRHYHR